MSPFRVVDSPQKTFLKAGVSEICPNPPHHAITIHQTRGNSGVVQGGTPAVMRLLFC